MTNKKTEALKPCEYCGHPLPQGVDKRTRQVRSHHFASCKVRLEQKALAEQPAQIPDAFDCLMREADKPTQVPEQLAKYVAALVNGTHEITSVTIRPKREWVGLTDEEVDDIYMGAGKHDLIRAREIEAKLKEKNA